jgi:hypothetical protein
VKKIQVLCIGKQAKRGFYFAAPDPEPALETVVGDGPVQGRMVLAELSQIAIIALRAMRNLSVIWVDMLRPKSVKAALPWLVFMVSQLLSFV